MGDSEIWGPLGSELESDESWDNQKMAVQIVLRLEKMVSRFVSCLTSISLWVHVKLLCDILLPLVPLYASPLNFGEPNSLQLTCTPIYLACTLLYGYNDLIFLCHSDNPSCSVFCSYECFDICFVALYEKPASAVQCEST